MATTTVEKPKVAETKFNVRPLIVSPSPREIPEFKPAMNKLPYDKVFAKYYPEQDAYRELKIYFMDHKEYTHMVIIPDDLIVNPEGFELLKKDLEGHDYAALGGICNLQYNDKERFACGPSISGGPSFHTEKSLQLEVEKQHSEIIQVQSEGFACLFISRDTLDKYPHIIRGMPNTSYDWGFSQTCYLEKIPIYVDTRARFLHLAGRAPGYLEYFYRGRKQPCMRFENDRGSVINTIKWGELPQV